MALEVKNPLASAEDIRYAYSILGSGRSPAREHGNPLQYSCLENPMDRGTWWATVYGVANNENQKEKLRNQSHSPLQQI